MINPWAIQSFLTFDSMDRTLKCDHSLESRRVIPFTVVLFVFNFTQFVILENFRLGTVKRLIILHLGLFFIDLRRN